MRQREVLELLAEGRSMKEAAAILDLTPRTVAFNKYRMMEQLRLKTSAELVQFAVREGSGYAPCPVALDATHHQEPR
jgi:DNA-binding CsgD family transcriptional regulator